MTTMTRATRRNVVMHLMRDGMTVPQIASELGVSRDTVRRDAEAVRQDAPQDTQDAQQVMRPVAVPDALQVAQYERETDSVRALLAERLSVEQMDALEASGEDAPSDAVASRLAALADWQDALQRLASTAEDTAAVRSFLAVERSAFERARAETNAVFVGWWFDGRTRLPDGPQDAEDVPRAARPDASALRLSETPQLARDLKALCAAYSARPEDAARFAIHQAARHLSAWQAARAHNEGRRTA
ncbi:transposase-like protein [Streptomyces sp. SAI-144]|uniref:helix-turn-helix domain-containing protein n=1 Tax=Streptomyces sp. SAI-144 TaxID=2940544 RepID=UPI002473A7F9|nr:helix-turn-helix domain-containing protein [Streptomyces sp. SAI-144]MDH6432614.1 transposase-like protein [Streptomyces sp. SAI-144]